MHTHNHTQDKLSGRPRQFAYIEYKNEKDAQDALEHMDGGQVDGQVISVEAVLPK